MESSEGSSNGSARRIESQLTHDGEGMTRPPTQATSAPSIIGGVLVSEKSIKFRTFHSCVKQAHMTTQWVSGTVAVWRYPLC